MRVLLTGASGMVGRNILDHPSRKNYNFITPPRVEINLTNYDQTHAGFKKYKPDVVIHAAGAVGGIKANINNPVKFLVDNSRMGMNVIMAAFKNKIKKLINLGSSCMYPKFSKNPLIEKSILTGSLEPTNEGYALAKIISQRLCTYIAHESPDYSYKTLIPCNLYGKFDDFSSDRSHLIPAIIRKVDEAKKSTNNTIEIWGNGNARREFMYAGDMADAIYFALDNYDRLDQTMNIGLGYDFTINDYYKIIASLMDYQGEFTHNLDMPSGMDQKLVSIDKQNEVGWAPTYALEDGLKETIQYYKEKKNNG